MDILEELYDSCMQELQNQGFRKLYDHLRGGVSMVYSV